MQLFDRIAGLAREHASFAVATVVARQSPVSSHLGDRALIFDDGHMEGFVGGSCSRDIVRRHALGAIAQRRPLLLQIRPAGRESDGAAGPPDATNAHGANAELNTERVVIPMSCSSEGAVDVYIEPHVPLRRLIVVGFTPVAEALARLAASLEYDVVRVVLDDELCDMSGAGAAPGDAVTGVRIVELRALRAFLDRLGDRAVEDLVAIIASQGHYDELALEVLLERNIAFTGLLASRRRATTVAGVLAQQGVSAQRLATVRNPVGLDIGARSPGEVAVSILAQIIAEARTAGRDADPPAGGANAAPSAASTAAQMESNDGVAVDPVCGMDVDVAGALYRFEHAGMPYFFCCAHCKAAFAADPEQYLLPLGST